MNARDRKHLTLRLNAILYDLENLRDWIGGQPEGPSEEAVEALISGKFKVEEEPDDEYVPGEETRQRENR